VSVYSTLFYSGPLTVAGAVIYTAASGVVIVVRDIEYYNFSGAAQTAQVARYVSGSTAGAVNYSVLPAVQQTTQWKGRAVINQLESIWVQGSSASIGIMVSGYLLS